MKIDQKFEASVRPIFFETGIEEFLYATHGGTLFLIEYHGRPYAVTCAHVFKDFKKQDLVIAQAQVPQQGSPAAGVRGHYIASNPTGASIDSDVLDICILDFEDNVTVEFFQGSAFVINGDTAGSSDDGHFLQVFGALKSKTKIEPPDMTVHYGYMDFYDKGEQGSDIVLRTAEGSWVESSIDDLTGISGAPVADRTTGKLCGMVVRGGVVDGKAIIHFIDMFDILKFLECSVGGKKTITYNKSVWDKRNLMG